MTGSMSKVITHSQSSAQGRKRQQAVLSRCQLKRPAYAFLALFAIQIVLPTASAQPVVPPGFTATTLVADAGTSLDLAAIAVDPASGDIYALTRSSFLPELIKVSSAGMVTTVTPADAFGTVAGFYPFSFTDLEFNATLAASTSSENLFSASNLGDIIGFNSTLAGGAPGLFALLPSGGLEVGLASSADGTTLFATSGAFPPSALFSIDGSGVVTTLLSGVTFPVATPSSLELSKDGASFFFSSLTAGGIFRIKDIATSPAVEPAPVVSLSTPANFAVDPISGELFIAGPPFGGAIERFDGSTLSTFGTGFGSIGDLAFGPSTDGSGGTSLFVTDRRSIIEISGFAGGGEPDRLCTSLPLLISELTDLADDPSTPKKVRKRLKKSQKHLEKALKRCDDEKIDKAFNEVDHALGDLRKGNKAAKGDDELKATLNEFSAELLALVQTETETIIDEAISAVGEDDKHVKKAQKHLAKALKNLEKGKIHKAMDEFIKAVRKAAKALKGAGGGAPMMAGDSDQLQDRVEITAPLSYRLLQNYPNPFNPSTTISYEIADEAFVTLIVYDVLGREEGVLVNRSQTPGRYQLSFNARDLPSGVYFYRLQVHDPVTGELYYLNSSKMILAK